MSEVTITDTVGTSGTVLVESTDVAEAITPWYPEAPQEVLDVIQTLQKNLNEGRSYTEELEYLGITIEYISYVETYDMSAPFALAELTEAIVTDILNRHGA